MSLREANSVYCSYTLCIGTKVVYNITENDIFSWKLLGYHTRESRSAENVKK